MRRLTRPLTAFWLPIVLCTPAAASAQSCAESFYRYDKGNGEIAGASVVADFDGVNGLDVAYITSDLYNKLSLALNLGNGTLATGSSYTVRQPAGLATADFDRMNGPDLVVSGELNQVFVFLNQGNGSFVPAPTLIAGLLPRAVVTVDLDGINGPDIAVANADSTRSEISVFLNTGLGTFGPEQRHIVSGSPDLLVSADIDRINGTDLIVGSSDRLAVSLLRNDGLGGLLPFALLPIGPTSIAVGDVDLLNGPDLVLSFGERAPVDLWLNDGSGGFTSAGPLPGSPKAASATFFDLDGANGLDLALSDGAETRVFPALATGGFGSPATYRPGGPAVAADLDGANRQDLVLSWVPTLHILFNRGDGSLNATLPPSYPVADEPLNLRLAKLGGGPGPDIVLGAGQNWLVLPGIGDGTFASAIPHGPADNVVCVGDFDRDGNIDVAGGSGFTEIGLHFGRGDGTFASRVTVFSQVWPDYFYDCAVADLDRRDGPDLVFTLGVFSATAVVLLNNGDGTMRIGETHSFKGPWLAVADLDGVNGPDIAVASLISGFPAANGGVEYRLNRGDGTFGSIQRISLSGQSVRGIVAADLDGKNGVDLVIGDSYGPDLMVLLNDGVSGFLPEVRYRAGWGCQTLHAADVDGDDSIDLVVGSVLSSEITVLANLGDGTFVDRLHLVGGPSPWSIGVADLNATGELDIVVANYAADTVDVHLDCIAQEWWLLRDDSIASYPPLPGALAGIFVGTSATLTLDIRGSDGVIDDGEGPTPTLPGSTDDDHAYTRGFRSGSLEPDASVVADTSRPLVFYQVPGEKSLKLVKDPGGLRISF